MNIIATITEADLGGVNHESLWPSFDDRPAARAVVMNELSQVALMHVSAVGYYKLPGGGIDEGESAEEALRRELKEETGIDRIDNLIELGIVMEYREEWSRRGVHHCYLAQISQPTSNPSRTQKEIDEGYEVVWAKNIEQAIELVESGTPKQYGQDFERAREMAILRYTHNSLGS